MRRLLTLLITVGALLLSACASPLGSVPTPEPWEPPPTVTAESTAVPPSPEAATPPAGTAVTATPATTSTELITYQVQRGSVVNSLQLDGRAVPSQQRDLSFPQVGTIDTIQVQSGGEIKKGQLLASLDAGPLADQLSQAQENYAKSKHTLDSATKDQNLAISRAQIDLEAAQAKLSRLQGPPDQIAVSKARAALSQAQAQLSKTRNDASAAKNQAAEKLSKAQQELQDVQYRYSNAYQELQKVTKNKKSSSESREKARDDFDEAEANLRTAQDAVATAQIDYDTARNNEVALIQDSEAQVAMAQAELDGLLGGATAADLDEARQAVKVAELDVATARAHAVPDPTLTQAVKDAQTTIDQIQKQIEEMRLYAPFNGKVSQVYAQEGDLIQEGQTIFVVLNAAVDPKQFQVETNVAADLGSDLPTVGLPVELQFARYSGRVITGTITSIISNGPDAALTDAGQASATPTSLQGSAQTSLPGMGPTSPPADSGAGTSTGAGQRYIIHFDAPDLELASGDQAQVTMTVARRDNALWLPPQAVHSEDQTYVMLLRGSAQDRVVVGVGIRSADRVEITSGLKEGDVVVGQS